MATENQSLGRGWDPGPFHCQMCSLEALPVACPEACLAPDPAKPSFSPPAPLGPLHSGLRAFWGWPEPWESGQSQFSLSSLYSPVPPLFPLESPFGGDQGLPFWGRLSQVSRILIFRARGAVTKFKVLPLPDLLWRRKQVQGRQEACLGPGGLRRSQVWGESSASPLSLRISAHSEPLVCSLWVASWTLGL